MKTRELDVLAVIRAPLENYPPSLNQVALLAEAGLRVGVADCAHPDYSPHVFSAETPVLRFHIGAHTQLFKESPPGLFEKLRRAFSFRIRVARLVRKYRPKVVIAYDPYAMSAVGPLWKKRNHPKIVWHFHELFLPSETAEGFLTKRSVAFAAKNADRVDAVVFPDADRARIYREETGNSFSPIVVMNCPPLLQEIPPETLTEKLAAEEPVPTDRVVFFQGWIGPSRCFEAIIRSMPHWPEDAVFALVGPVRESYRDELLRLGAEVGAGNRIRFLGAVPYCDLNPLSAGATVGVSLVNADESESNWKYCSGAINKRFEYMAVGVFQVPNTGPGMMAVIEDTRSGLLADASSPPGIGAAIAGLLSDPSKRKRMGEDARRAHIDQFCYERQFRPLAERIESWCADGR